VMPCGWFDNLIMKILKGGYRNGGARSVSWGRIIGGGK
jgi:hypothetical protein